MILTRRRRIGGAGIFSYFSAPVRELIKRFYLAILVLLSIFMIYFSITGTAILNNIKFSVTDFFAPVLNVLVIPIDVVIKGTSKIGNYFFVISENEKLREENKHLQRQLTVMSQVMADNYRLKELLGYVEDIGYNFVSARVIGDASGPFVRSVLVNSGTKDGVAKGQAVLNSDGLVGRVIEVGPNTARVLLITDINSKIPVITSASNERSIMSGQNDSSPKLLYLAKDTALQEGERVFTSGDGEVFPPDLPVGVVFNGGENKYLVKPHVRWNRLEYVSILSSYILEPNPVAEKVDGEPVTGSDNNEKSTGEKKLIEGGT